MSSVTLMARLGADSTGSPPDQRVRPGPRSGSEALQTGHARLFLVSGMMASIFIVIAVRLLVLVAPDGPIISANNLASALPVQSRAEITDRNGILLATSLSVATLYANPQALLDVDKAADSLAPYLPNLSKQQLVKRLSNLEKKNVWLRRKLTPRQQAKIHELGIPGVDFEYEDKRLYPHGPLFAHVIGHVNIDNDGQAGLEKGLNNFLQTQSEPIQTSLDLRIQHILKGELLSAIQNFQAIGAAGTVMDVKTGEILSMVSLPDFDPNRVPQSPEDARFFNRSTLGIYEPGSTLKIMTIAMALEYGTATLEKKFDATKPLRIAKFTINDTYAENRWLSVPEIFIHSSNIGAARIAMDIGPERQKSFLKRIGLLEKPTTEIEEVGTPMFPTLWGEVRTMTVSYGHGVAVSQLQLAGAFAAIVNGGLKVKPTFVANKTSQETERVLSRENSQILSNLLRLNVLEGTGKQADVPGFMVGGKTGTAEKAVAGGYDTESVITSFVAAFPMDSPRYLVLVMLDEPKGTEQTHGFAYAGWNAAPTVAKVISRIGPLLGVLPGNDSKDENANALLVSLREGEVGG